MTSFASSASPELVHWHDQKPVHLMDSVFSEGFHGAIEEAREIIVEAEYSLTKIAAELGIEHFAHNISCDLTGCRLVLQPQGQLEIHRTGQKYATSFPVQFSV